MKKHKQEQLYYVFRALASLHSSLCLDLTWRKNTAPFLAIKRSCAILKKRRQLLRVTIR